MLGAEQGVVGLAAQHAAVLAQQQRRADALVQPFGLVARPVPVVLPDASISVFWHARQHKDAANRWLRALAFERFGAA